MTTETTRHLNPRPLISAGTLLGIGLGGFVDGIVLHQMLQVHNMLSARRPKETRFWYRWSRFIQHRPWPSMLGATALLLFLPKLLSVKARIAPLQAAVATTASTAKELAEMGPKFAQSFKDQAMCVSGQVAAAVNAAASIEANVSVSVEVSAEASASAGT